MSTDHFSGLRRALFVVALFGAVLAKAAESPTDIVQRIDQSRLEAMRKGDGTALARVFSDEMVFIHSDGRSESKKDYVKNMTAGDTAYTDIKTYDVNVRQIAPEVILLSGAQDMRKKLGSTWSDIKIRFLSVWKNEGGTWRMVAWQSMKPSGNSVVPSK
jgi:ketosteroid isomerase-like protein